jgi:hypothetical protein
MSHARQYVQRTSLGAPGTTVVGEGGLLLVVLAPYKLKLLAEFPGRGDKNLLEWDATDVGLQHLIVTALAQTGKIIALHALCAGNKQFLDINILCVVSVPINPVPSGPPALQPTAASGNSVPWDVVGSVCLCYTTLVSVLSKTQAMHSSLPLQVPYGPWAHEIAGPGYRPPGLLISPRRAPFARSQGQGWGIPARLKGRLPVSVPATSCQ